MTEHLHGTPEREQIAALHATVKGYFDSWLHPQEDAVRSRVPSHMIHTESEDLTLREAAEHYGVAKTIGTKLVNTLIGESDLPFTRPVRFEIQDPWGTYVFGADSQSDQVWVELSETYGAYFSKTRPIMRASVTPDAIEYQLHNAPRDTFLSSRPLLRPDETFTSLKIPAGLVVPNSVPLEEKITVVEQIFAIADRSLPSA